VTFITVDDQRLHFRSDWHRYNVKLRLKASYSGSDFKPVAEEAFDELAEVSSIEASDDDDDDDEDEDQVEKNDDSLGGSKKKLSKLMKGLDLDGEALDNDGDEEDGSVRKKQGGGGPGNPFVVFEVPEDDTSATASAIDAKKKKGAFVYKQVLVGKKDLDTLADLPSLIRTLQTFQIGSSAESSNQYIVILMLGAGHFAGAVFDCSITLSAMKGGKGAAPGDPVPVAHKTFHRYTTRRKQGGAQSRCVFNLFSL
jgi:hypothetical protein